MISLYVILLHLICIELSELGNIEYKRCYCPKGSLARQHFEKHSLTNQWLLQQCVCIEIYKKIQIRKTQGTARLFSKCATGIQLQKNDAAVRSAVQYNRGALFRMCRAFCLCSCKT